MLSRLTKKFPNIADVDPEMSEILEKAFADDPPRPEPTIIRGPRIEKTLESMIKARDGTQQILNDLLAEKARIENEILLTAIQLDVWTAACEKMSSKQLDIPGVLNNQ